MPHHEAAERQLRFLEIDQTTIDSLQQLKDSLEAGIEEHLDEFYAHILEQPELRSLFSDKESIARARASQGRYWLKHMFAKRFDRGQFEQAEEIASAHLRVGLEPSWYMSSYCWMLNRFVEQSRASRR
jgi:methyl-accepting chemotaxis protein